MHHGPRQASAVTAARPTLPRRPGQGAPAHLQVSPTELVLTPGQTVKLRVRLFDDKGPLLREETGADMVARGPQGHGRQQHVHRGGGPGRAGRADHRHVGGLTGSARARGVRPLPWKEGFDSYADGACRRLGQHHRRDSCRW